MTAQDNIDSLKTSPQSYWLDSTEGKAHPSLEQDIAVDVAIIGGGMAGITTATMLKEAGLRVAILEADRILQGTTAYTTAKVTSQHSLIYDKIQKQLGWEMAQQYAQANQWAIEAIANRIKTKNIDCDFSLQSAYVYTQSNQYINNIVDEAVTAHKLGIKASYVDNLPLPFAIKGALQFENQGQFHPRKYLLALAKEIPGDGSYIFEKTKAVDIVEGDICQVITEQGGRVKAYHVVIASHYPFYDSKGLYFARIYTERSYVVAIKAKELFPGGMYISAESPTRSLRYQDYRGEQMILVGGENHKTGHGKDTSTHYDNLRSFAQQNFTVEQELYHWSTQDCMTMDGLPYVGRLTSNTQNIYLATGFGKWGMTNSTVSAKIIRDLIITGSNPWMEVYSPSRINPKGSAANFIVQNLDVAGNFLWGKMAPMLNQAKLEKDKAVSFKIDGDTMGIYMDQDINLHMVDTTCTHMGCELKWNAGEKSWDCPCHGSRFSYKGEVVEGPALKPLEYKFVKVSQGIQST